MKRRHVSGIYIFDKFPDEEKRKPTCIEDCQEETLRKWLQTKDKEYLEEVAVQICKVLRGICDQFDIVAREEDDE